MDVARRVARPELAPGSLVLAILVALIPTTSPAFAQAWVPPAGVGSVSVSFQGIDNTGHRLTDGSLAENGRSLNADIYVEVEYGITDRLSVLASLPYVFGKYVDPDPPP